MSLLSQTSVSGTIRDIRVLIMVLIPILWLVWLSVDHGANFPPSAIKRFFTQRAATHSDNNDLSWNISALKPGAPGRAVDSARQEVLASIFQRQRIPVNLVDFELLQTVPGIGKQLAARIVEERRAHGPYKSAEDLMRVAGIGIGRSRQFEQVLRFD